MSECANEIAVLRDFYQALNRNDIGAMLRALDPNVEWAEFIEEPTGRTYRGLDEVRAHIAGARGQWAEGACEPERFVVAGDKIVALVRVRVRLKRETEWREGELADVYTFRDGRIVHVRIFLDRRRALEWAGVPPDGPKGA